MLGLAKFQELLRAYEGDEEAVAFLLSCARAFMDYTHAVYDKELARLAYPKGADRRGALSQRDEGAG